MAKKTIQPHVGNGLAKGCEPKGSGKKKGDDKAKKGAKKR